MAYTTIDKPSDYFNTKLYTGNGSTQTISSVGFQPDWTWLKHRDGATAHMIFDSVRGALYRLQSNSDNTSVSAANTLTSWNSDGFALGTENDTNGSGRLFTSWNWKAGTSFTNDASSTGIGTIDSAGSVNNDSGFSIVSYTGNATDNASVKHGLNTAPKMVIIKDLSDTSTWGVWHQSLTNAGYRLTLSTTGAQTDDTAFLGGSSRTLPTSSVFSLGGGGGGNGANANIAYCFAEKQGYSKFGSYTGNGNADGAFIYTGFKPAWIMVKRISAAGSWLIYDNKRNTFNVADKEILAESNIAEDSVGRFDILSNGFKNKTSNNANNADGSIYIYMAFAENPFVTSTGVPATAR
jgi:hypothetical protein